MFNLERKILKNSLNLETSQNAALEATISLDQVNFVHHIYVGGI